MLFHDFAIRLGEVSLADIRPPQKEVGKDEEFIGILPSAIRPFYALKDGAQNKFNKFIEKVKKQVPEAKTLRDIPINILDEFYLIHIEYKLSADVFRACLNEEYSVHMRHHLDVRSGWKVVACPGEDPCFLEVCVLVTRSLSL